MSGRQKSFSGFRPLKLFCIGFSFYIPRDAQ